MSWSGIFFLCLHALARPAQSKIVEVFVDPILGIDNIDESAGSKLLPLRTVYAARDKVRSILQKEKAGVSLYLLRAETMPWDVLRLDLVCPVFIVSTIFHVEEVIVQLLPGTHQVGAQPLRLGPLDGGDEDTLVTWRYIRVPCKST